MLLGPPKFFSSFHKDHGLILVGPPEFVVLRYPVVLLKLGDGPPKTNDQHTLSSLDHPITLHSVCVFVYLKDNKNI